jgi:hypothetical protein
MSIITGSLAAAMQAYHGPGHQVAVLIIDEQTNVPMPFLADQQQILVAAQNRGLQIWQVELNPHINQPNPPANRPTNPGLAVPGAHVLTKPHINAFASNAQPNLHAQLQAAGITMLVVMGYHVNQCVRATSVGGPDRPNGLHRPGATQLGYIVLSCDQILRGGQATWKLETGVRFYTAL